MKPDPIDVDAEMAPYSDLDAEIGGWNPPGYEPTVVVPRKCRRHDWSASADVAAGSAELTWSCRRCGHVRDDARVSRGRRARNRGNAVEREVAAKLGLRRVGQYGTEVDASSDWLIAQVKSGGAFSERYWSWLNAMSATAAQTRVLVVTDAPGPGRRRRAMVVTTLEEWQSLHGGEPRRER